MKTQATISQPAAVPGSPLLQVSGALFGIIAFILIAAWLVKRFGLAGKTAGAHGLKVSASTTLGPRERVVIVEVDDARLVLGVTASNISVLHKLPPAPAAVDERAETPADFQSVMKSLLKRSGRS
ncbi:MULTISPECIES: flagellar biosynthetic protein FliO [Enterobacter]|uniref:flagellar biosynthetic protein FliO n=1 Tax=Enterobacter TaxID=547 RepID=UPI001CC16B22|nr:MULTISPECIES: flagellar biosynthetic protein FliO [Enterobacter]MCK7226830.1 flagellar type III secretion system protein FliO [Enterobacter asburiae]UAN39341.1 flagellar type III secretion system protein FliO [Enterobacter sp. JBIWA008]UXP25603.1 flagellar biosynthetic protein FliO [Enterobacter sp. 155105]